MSIMKNYILGILIAATTLVGLQSFKPAPVSFDGEGIVVIVNKDNPVTELTSGSAKLYYLRKIKRRWPAIEKTIKPVDRKGSPALKNAFFTQVLEMSVEAGNNYFTQRQFSNSEMPPVQLDSDEEVVSYVAENIGAIGYISKSAYQSSRDKVKAVLILD